MPYNPPSTVTDKPSALNMQGFVGNELIVRLNVLGDAPMPATVDCIASYSGGGRELPDALQPSTSIDGRAVVIHFAASDKYPYAAWQKILWDGRAVLSGDLTFSREANRTGPSTSSINVTVSDGQVVNVSVLIGASAGGGVDTGVVSLTTNEAIPAGRLVVNVGGKAALYNTLTPAHAYALIGISAQSAPVGGIVDIRTKGTVVIPGWGLISGQTYRAGQSGSLSVTKPVGGFSQIVGRAISADSFLFNPQPIIY